MTGPSATTQERGARNALLLLDAGQRGVGVGLGRIVALHDRSSTSYQIR
jgi:hypothetical protein